MEVQGKERREGVQRPCKRSVELGDDQREVLSSGCSATRPLALALGSETARSEALARHELRLRCDLRAQTWVCASD